MGGEVCNGVGGDTVVGAVGIVGAFSGAGAGVVGAFSGDTGAFEGAAGFS